MVYGIIITVSSYWGLCAERLGCTVLHFTHILILTFQHFPLLYQWGSWSWEKLYHLKLLSWSVGSPLTSFQHQKPCFCLPHCPTSWMFSHFFPLWLFIYSLKKDNGLWENIKALLLFSQRAMPKPEWPVILKMATLDFWVSMFTDASFFPAGCTKS